MDADRFDTLGRALSSGAARRTVLAGLASGLLSVFTQPAAEQAAAKKRKCKKKRKKCRRCRPNCDGKNCGPDGCGGSCGSCSGGTCTGGTCACEGTLVLCRGACIPGCIGDAVINPQTCDCCQTGPPCETDAECCSGICQPNSGGGPDYCRRRDLGDSCDFDAQCNQTPCPGCPQHVCRDGRCACPDGLEVCGGECVPPCTGPNVRIPGTCACCRRHGQSCSGITQCCSEQCISGTCVGLPFDAPCDFDEQCASEECTLGFCNV